jgi:CRP-like cAMP-binding protein
LALAHTLESEHTQTSTGKGIIVAIMPASQKRIIPVHNKLLGSLPPLEFERLQPHLRSVRLSVGEAIYETDHVLQGVYFLNSGVVSHILTSKEGTDVEVGIVGNEGALGTIAMLGNGKTTNRAVVQISGQGWWIDARILREMFVRGGRLQTLLLRHLQASLDQTSQIVLCNRLHTVEERFSRWLLMTRDRVDCDDLPLTQEFISNMLGTRRSGVTVAAGILRQAGLIDYRRGSITILNREGLEQTACECYSTIRDRFTRLYIAS